MFHTVPVVAYAWLVHHGDFAASVESVVDCGGDADTTGAIAGALAGATVGLSGIPEDWVDGVRDWPRGIEHCEEVAARLTNVVQSHQPATSVRYCWPCVIPRNLFFLLVVVSHGFRRLLPPY